MATDSIERTSLDSLSLPDETAYEVVHRVYAASRQKMYGFVRRLGLDDEEASDAVQEAMLRLCRAIAETPVADPEAWTYRVLYRHAMDVHRGRRRLRLLTARLRPRDDARDGDPASRSTVDAVWHEVDRLPERQRAVLYLRYRADMPFERIGDALGVTASAARSYAATGLATLRRRLADEER